MNRTNPQSKHVTMKTGTPELFRPIALAAMFILSTFVRADVISDWNLTAITAIKAGNPNVQLASRALAMTHVAQFDAVNAVTRCYKPYAADLSVPSASP